MSNFSDKRKLIVFNNNNNINFDPFLFIFNSADATQYETQFYIENNILNTIFNKKYLGSFFVSNIY